MQTRNSSNSPLLNLSNQALIQVLSFLDLQTIFSCYSVCKELNSRMGQGLWKNLCLRDHLLSLIDKPLKEEDLKFPEVESDIKTIKEEQEEADKMIVNPFEEVEKVIRKDFDHSIFLQIKPPEDWKGLYIDCYSKLDLSGEWEGFYGSFQKEQLTFFHKGFQVYARKNTGHSNIPKGKLTWKMKLNESMNKGKGEIHLADACFKNPRWSTAFFEIVNPNFVLTTWFTKDFSSRWIKVTFASVRARPKGSPISGMSVKFEPLKLKSQMETVE